MSMENPFPLELEGVTFLMTTVQTIEGFSPGAHNTVLSPRNQVAVRTDPQDKKVLLCVMRTKFNEERSTDGPYFVDIECAAKFTVLDETLTEDQAKRGVLITGHNVVYGAIREAVNWITSRHVHGPLVLGLSVLQLKTEAEANADAAAEEPHSPAP